MRSSRSRLRPLLVACAALGLAALGTAPAGAQGTDGGVLTPEEKAAAIAEPGVVYIETYWHAYVNTRDDFGYLGPYDFAMRGSGFVVSTDGAVATAGHVVDPGINGVLTTVMQYAVADLVNQGLVPPESAQDYFNYALGVWTAEGDVAGTPMDRSVYVQHGAAAAGLKTGEVWPARVIEFKSLEEGDVALLKVEAKNLPVLQVAEDADIAIGTEILSVGYPGSSDAVTDATYEPTFKDGKVNSKKTRGDGLLPVYEMSAALSGGMSGGPTVDLEGNVVGVNSFTISGETQAFNFLSPASLLRELLVRNGVNNSLGPVDESYRAGIAALDQGDNAAAIAAFDAVLDRVPSHQLAQEYRTRAVEARAAEPPTTVAPTTAPAVVATAAPVTTAAPADEGGGVPVALAIGVVVLLLAAVAGGTVLVLRRKRTPSPAPVAAAMATPITPPAPPARPWPAAEDVPHGTEATEVPDVVHFCTECGTHVEGGEHFCPACGHPVHRAPHPLDH